MSDPDIYHINGQAVDTVQDDGAQWHVTFVGGETCSVPKDPRHKHHRMIQRWIAEGNTPADGEGGARRRMRSRLQEDPMLRALALELADLTGRTEAEQAQALIDHITRGQ